MTSFPPKRKSAPSEARASRPPRRGGGFSRRAFVGGAAAGVAGAAALGTISLTGCSSSGDDWVGDPQNISDEDLISYVADDFEYVEETFTPLYTWTLPLGTLLYYSEGSWSAAMMAPESALYVNTLGAVSLLTGEQVTLVTEPVSGSRYGFYDVRCSAKVFVWVEENFNTGDWVLIAQQFASGALSGSAVQLDSGDADWEPPKIAVTGKSVIWYKMPLASGSQSSSYSHCYRWTLGESEGVELYESPGRFAANPRISDGVLTICPRVNASSGTYYGLTAIDMDAEDAIIARLVMPSTVKPFEAVYMNDTFAFSVEANYGYGGYLGNMGSYIGLSGGPYVALSREPLACIGGKGSRYYVKVLSSHYVLDTEALTYSVLTAPNDTLDYGDYPAGEGESTMFVTYCTLRGEDGPPESVCMRVFEL